MGKVDAQSTASLMWPLSRSGLNPARVATDVDFATAGGFTPEAAPGPLTHVPGVGSEAHLMMGDASAVVPAWAKFRTRSSYRSRSIRFEGDLARSLHAGVRPGSSDAATVHNPLEAVPADPPAC
ncbi:MAG: hypothetical protein IT193_15685 [Propionibacteriaceae bacterium]|nr:hypothetical protein [Propionibacteriaceae bacterium]